MSDEYLFEKQGTDAEIEKFEELLSAYRLSPVVPKLARAKGGKTSGSVFNWFKLSYAVAFASLLIVCAGAVLSIRYVYQVNREVTAARPVDTPEIDRMVLTSANSEQAAIDNSPSVAVRVPTVPSAKAPSRVKTIPRSHQRSLVAKTIEKTPRLTKEEQYAYDQLKVALWITGSKLRVVQDTIDRVDDHRPATANERR
jgi:hypothetical protein